MDDIATIERPGEEVHAPPTAPSRPSRSGGIALLAVVAAAVLGISALGAGLSGQTGAARLLANGAATPGGTPAGTAASAQAGTTPAGHQAAQAQDQEAQGQEAQAQEAPGGSAPAAPSAGAEHTVQIQGLKFSPQTLDIATGDTVTWVNADTVPHTVTVTDGPEKFDSQTIAPGASFSHTFTQPGMYSYYCAVHPDMTASVMVADGAPAAPAPPPGGGASAPPHGGDAGAAPAPGEAGQCVPATALDTLMQHVKAAHLQESPGQQAADLLALDQYVKTHTVLVQNMFGPALDGKVSDSTSASMNALWQHVKSAHLQESPSQQLADLLAADQYVKTHTVLVQNVLDPLFTSAAC